MLVYELCLHFFLGGGANILTVVYRLNSPHCPHYLDRGELIVAQLGFMFFLSSLSFCIDKMKGRKKDWLRLNHFLTLWKKLSATLSGSSAVVATFQSNTDKNSPLLCYLHQTGRGVGVTKVPFLQLVPPTLPPLPPHQEEEGQAEPHICHRKQGIFFPAFGQIIGSMVGRFHIADFFFFLF